MVVAAIVLFLGVLFLNVEKNEQGRWEVGSVSSFAQGGESESIVQVYHYNLNTVTAGVPDFASGVAHLFPNPGTNPGVATVTVPSYTFRSVIYTKTSDGSNVGVAGSGSYNITYKADYTTSGAPVGTISVMDSFVESL